MKAVILCICLAWCCPWAKTPGPRIHFREYRIGPVTYRGSFPFFDVWEAMPDSLREMLGRLPRTLSVDTGEIRKRDTGIHDWNPRAHGGTRPIAIRDGLLTVDTLGILLHGDDTAHFAVRKNGKELYRFQACDPVRDPILGFSAWGDKWILQTWNHLVVDGEDVNKKIGSDEVFNGRAFGDGLFYFAKAKDRAYRAYRNGIPFGKHYDFIPHDYCCGNAVMNVRDDERWIWFFGIRKGKWYLAIIESERPTTSNSLP